ncbi:hypothetical protein, partial [Candidatus Ichthyocystis hellenicum]|uniref:hypothetical protein n=2 Tax=Candidatus Ichthyocystis TaxID=2929841 RepID=UPI00158543B8
FYNTPMAGVVSSLVDKMLKAHEDLIGGLVLGRGTILGLEDNLDEDDFMRSNERLIEALMDSVEAPAAVAMDGTDTRRGRPSSAQGHSSTAPDAEVGFVLEPHLARELGMQRGEMIFRGMFYNTQRAFRVSRLVSRLLSEQEELVRRSLLGDGTSSVIRYSGEGVVFSPLIKSKAATIQALVSSMEAPLPAIVPAVIEISSDEDLEEGKAVEHGTRAAELDNRGKLREAAESESEKGKLGRGSVEVPAVVVVDDVDTRGQSSSAQGHSSAVPGAGVGFLLEPHLARELGVQHGEMIFRGTFYGTPLAPLVSQIINRLLSEQEGLVRRGLLGEGTSSVVQSSGDGVVFSDLIKSNAATIQALVSSIEAPLPEENLENRRKLRKERMIARAERREDRLGRELEGRLAKFAGSLEKLAVEERARAERAIRIARSEERMAAQARALAGVSETIEEVIAAAREEYVEEDSE